MAFPPMDSVFHSLSHEDHLSLSLFHLDQTRFIHYLTVPFGVESAYTRIEQTPI